MMRLSRLLSPVLCVAVVVACLCASLLVVSVASAEVHAPEGSFGVTGPGSAGFAAVRGVAVDRASGDVFVYDNDELTGGSIYKFDAAGKPIDFTVAKAPVIHGVGVSPFAAFQELAVSQAGATKGDLYAANGSTVDIYSSATGEKLGELNSEVPVGAPWGAPCGVAVDAAGDVYVGTETGGVTGGVNRYVPTGEVVKNEDWSGSLRNVGYEACNLAVDGAQNTYVTSWESGPVRKYAISEYHAAEESAGPGTVVDPNGSSMAVDPVNDDLYVDEVNQVRQLDSSGTLLSVIGGSELHGSFGVATAGGDGKLYVANTTTVAIFGAGETPPPVVANDTPIYNLTRSSVVLTATVNSLGTSLADCHFEYGTTTGYGTSGPCESVPPAGSDPAEVILRVEGLTPGTTYHYRLVAGDTGGVTRGPDASFTTPDPAPVTCTNGALRTGPSANLPDCRAYEQVSPVQKAGADVFPDPTRDRLSTDGNAANFVSDNGFAGAESVPGTTEYLAARTSTGWETHSISPKQASLSVGLVTTDAKPGFRFVSPDLGAGVFFALSPLTDNSSTASVPNIYVRRDLKTPGPGAYELVSPCPACERVGGSPLEKPLTQDAYEEAHYFIAGTSADFKHVVFVTRENLTSDAPGNCPIQEENERPQCPYKVYDAHDGTVSLVSIRPDGTPAPKADAGAGATGNGGLAAPNVVSSDGSRIVFTDTSNGETVQEQEDTFGSGTARGDLYERIGDSTTVQINVSERAIPDAHSAATFFDASADGTRVFFAANQALTEDAPLNGAKLYLWDARAPEGHRLTLISPEPGADAIADGAAPVGAIGVSSDGDYLYFIAHGRWTADQPVVDDSTGVAIYVWHDGTVRYIEDGVEGSHDESADVKPDSSALEPFKAQLSPDGRHLLFSLTRGLQINGEPNPNGYEQHRQSEMYTYDYANNSVVCASCNPSGAPASATARSRPLTNDPIIQDSEYDSHPMSDDGRFVFFSTEESLVPQDTNNALDAYEYDTATGQVHLLSTGTSPDPSEFMDATPDGSNAMIDTFEPLIGEDQDTNEDVYDARVNGGLAAQNIVAPKPCTDSSGCQGPGLAPQSPEAPPSVTFLGPGNPAAAPAGASHASARVSVSGARVRSGALVLSVAITAPGLLTVTGPGVVRLDRLLPRAGRFRITAPLTGAERRLLRAHRRTLRIKVTLAAPAGGVSVNASIAAGR
jgi:hypothetical protein